MFSFFKKKEENANLDVKRILADSYPEEAFRFVDGFVVRNMSELLSHIIFSKDDVFFYHVNKDKNDFANWIGEVLSDYTLSNDLKKCIEKKKYIKIIQKRLNELNKIYFKKYVYPRLQKDKQKK